MITSRANKYIKYTKELLTKKGRDKHASFILEGEKFVLENIEKAEFLLVSEEFWAKKGKLLQKSNIHIIDNSIFLELSDLKNSSGIMSIIKKDSIDTNKNKNSIVIILENMQDMGNIGAIFRTAYCSGIVSHIYLSKGCADVYSQKIMRSSASFILKTNFTQNSDLELIIEKLKENDYKIYASTAIAKDNIFESRFFDKTAIIIGNEGQGISQKLLSISDFKIKIPSIGESLNAANAASIMIYEAYRQIK